VQIVCWKYSRQTRTNSVGDSKPYFVQYSGRAELIRTKLASNDMRQQMKVGKGGAAGSCCRGRVTAYCSGHTATPKAPAMQKKKKKKKKRGYRAATPKAPAMQKKEEEGLQGVFKRLRRNRHQLEKGPQMAQRGPSLK
jgi:hypothetical protein